MGYRPYAPLMSVFPLSRGRVLYLTMADLYGCPTWLWLGVGVSCMTFDRDSRWTPFFTSHFYGLLPIWSFLPEEGTSFLTVPVHQTEMIEDITIPRTTYIEIGLHIAVTNYFQRCYEENVNCVKPDIRRDKNQQRSSWKRQNHHSCMRGRQTFLDKQAGRFFPINLHS